MSCWQAVEYGVKLCDQGVLPADKREAWRQSRREIAAWIEENCWSEARASYVAWPGADALDASLALSVRFGFGSPARQEATLAAIDGELNSGLFHHRFSGVQSSEGCFLACSFWMAEAKARLGRKEEAKASFETLVAALGGIGPLPEMVEAGTGLWLGNMPQGLTHTAIIQAANAIGSPSL
jgi:GH15 family glucan-1,4-alpha-glucosidase